MISESELREKMEALELALREAGVYVGNIQVIMPPQEGEETDPTQQRPQTPGNALVIADCLLGDVAFSKRVQDPEQADWDASFREISRGFMSESFEEERRKLREALGLEDEPDA